jgi:hypothetical protein
MSGVAKAAAKTSGSNGFIVTPVKDNIASFSQYAMVELCKFTIKNAATDLV